MFVPPDEAAAPSKALATRKLGIAAALVAAGFVCLGFGNVCAQDVFVDVVEAAAPAPAAAGSAVDINNQPFMLPTQSTESMEAMEEFRRLSARGVWERAIRLLDEAAKKSKGFVARPDGVMLPSALLMQQSLAELPPAGKAAYRLFYDAEAKKLLSEAQGKDEAAKLSQIVEAYLITSIGDVAADRLGDLYFELGNFDGAVRAWQSIVTYRADSTLPRAQTLVKIGIGLVRAGRWEEFREVQRDLRQRHEGETVELGGKRVSPTAHLAALAKRSAPQGASKPALAQTTAADFKLPTSDEPLWRWCPFGKMTGLRMNDRFGRNTSIDMAMPAKSDGRRVYANLLGYQVALDLETGKLLWRTGKYADLIQKLGQNQIVYPEQFTLAVAGDRIWCISGAIANQGSRAGGYLTCLEAASGKELLHSSKISTLQNWNFTGTPVLDGDRVYVTVHKLNPGTELHVLALAASDGKVLWDALIGTHKVDQFQNNYYYRRTAQPSLVLRPGKVIVDSHAGALAELDARSGRLNWGVIYESEMTNNNYDYNEIQRVYVAGDPYFAGGLLFSKGMRSTRLLALRPDGPSLAWKRPVSELSMIAGADDDRVYLAGDEMTAYDIKTQDLIWSAKVSLGTGIIQPLLTATRLYQFSPRGIYEIDKTSGSVVRVFRGADTDSSGGQLFVASDVLVTTSNLAITAYKITRP